MFVAETIDGNRISSLCSAVDIENIRHSVQADTVRCPECKMPVRLRTGQLKRPHFYHVRNECSYKYSEPETLEHSEGKLLIAAWLKACYPNAQVEIEYKVKETEQRTDVMLVLENGTRVAFEFQCSSINLDIWRVRHELYISAGIKDVWILGISRIDLKKKYLSPKAMDLEISASVPIICGTNRSILYIDTEKVTFVAIDMELLNDKPRIFTVASGLIKLDSRIIIDTQSGIKSYIRRLENEEAEKATQTEKIKHNRMIGMRNWSQKPGFNLLDTDIELLYPDEFNFPQLDWKLLIYRVCIHKAIENSRLNLNPTKISYLLMKEGYAKSIMVEPDINAFFNYLCKRGMLMELMNDDYVIVYDTLDLIPVQRKTIVYPYAICPRCNGQMKFETYRDKDEKFGWVTNYDLICSRCFEIYSLNPPFCKLCKRPLVIKNMYTKPFWGCNQYPHCKYTVNIEFRMPLIKEIKSED